MFAEKPGFQYLPHTADVKFKAEGKDLADAFKNAAFASFNVIVNTDKVKKKIKKTINIEAKRELSLLYDFLEELLFLLDTEGFLLASIDKIEVKKETEDRFTVTATIQGDVYTQENKYDVQGNIKSVTYNDMDIKQTDGGYELTVVLDL